MLAAAAAGLRATSGLPPLPAGRADRYLAAAGRLDEGAAALLWSRGLALSPEAAIDLAIEQALRAPRLGGAPGTPGTAGALGALGAIGATTGAAAHGGVTAREREIAVLIASGRSNKG